MHESNNHDDGLAFFLLANMADKQEAIWQDAAKTIAMRKIYR